ncbi:MAG: PD40 domain-containing protein [Chloroflexi bacterium]|nr:PD40 domain-containing protein [Chloroflexota bacterium]
MKIHHTHTLLKLLLLTIIAASPSCRPVSAVPSPTSTPAPSQTSTANPIITPEKVQPYGTIVMSNAYGIYSFDVQTREQTTIFTKSYHRFDGESVSYGNGYIYFIGSTTPESNKDSYPDFSLDIFQVGIDGSGLKQLTNTGHIKHSLSVSPNGRYMLYTSNQNAQYQLFALDTLTYETNIITTSVSQTRAHGFFFATWSSDSNQVAFFEAQQGRGYLQLYLYNFEADRLSTVLPEGTLPWSSLAWSVDDKKILFPIHGEKGKGIYSFDLQSNSVSLVALTNGLPRYFVQSPDRASILFEIEDSNGQMKLCLLNASTQDIITIQEDSIFPHSTYRAAWSPDSQDVVYTILSEHNDWQLKIKNLETNEDIVIPFPPNTGFSSHFLWIYP